MKAWRRTGGWLLLLLTVAGFLGYRYIRFVLANPATVNLAAMPEEEFAQNRSLFLADEGEELPYAVSVEQAQDYLDLLRDTKSPDYLLWEVRITRSSGDRSRTQFGTYLRQGADYDVEVREGGSLQRSVRSRGGAVTVSTSEGSRATAAERVYEPLPVLGMADIATLAALDPQYVLDARFDTLDSRQVVYVEFTYPDLDIQERYWVSLELGLPLQVETRLGEELIYQAVTSAISDVPPQPPEQPEAA